MTDKTSNKVQDILILTQFDPKKILDEAPDVNLEGFTDAVKIFRMALGVDLDRLKDLLGNDALKGLAGTFMTLEGEDLFALKLLCYSVITPLMEKCDALMTMVKNMECLRK